MAIGRTPSSESSRSKPGPSLLISFRRPMIIHGRLLLDLLQQEPVKQWPGVQIVFGLCRPVELSDRRGDFLFVLQSQLEAVLDRGDDFVFWTLDRADHRTIAAVADVIDELVRVHNLFVSLVPQPPP